MLNFIPFFAARNAAKAKAKARAEFMSQFRAGWAALSEIHDVMSMHLGVDVNNVTQKDIQTAALVGMALHEILKTLPKQ
jgi:hypothetical protein